MSEKSANAAPEIAGYIRQELDGLRTAALALAGNLEDTLRSANGSATQLTDDPWLTASAMPAGIGSINAESGPRHVPQARGQTLATIYADAGERLESLVKPFVERCERVRVAVAGHLATLGEACGPAARAAELREQRKALDKEIAGLEKTVAAESVESALPAVAGAVEKYTGVPYVRDNEPASV